MEPPGPNSVSPGPAAPAIARFLGFFAFWLVLAEVQVRDGAGKLAADGAIGLLGAGVATWISLRLLPSRTFGVSLVGLPGLAVHFLRQSVVAGVDVARRAFDPRLPLNPGYVEYRVGLPAGPGRDAFTALTSLLPGTLPVEVGTDGVVRYHCLDVGQPVARQLALDEAVLQRALRSGVGPVEPRNP